MIAITRLILQPRTWRLISVLTRFRVRVKKRVEPIQALMVSNGCSEPGASQARRGGDRINQVPTGCCSGKPVCIVTRSAINWPLHMFVRFRQGARRLQLSLVETRRLNGRVQHEHIGGLGSARLPLSPETRLEFWTKLHPRLARLANRLDDAAQATVLAAVHARIPMVTGDERRALQLEAAKADLKFWEVMQESNEEMSGGYRAMATDADRHSTAAKQAAEGAAKHAAAAKNRIDRLDRGEDIGATTKVDMRALAHSVGITDADMRHWANVARIYKVGAENEYLNAIGPDQQRERRIARKILRATERRQ